MLEFLLLLMEDTGGVGEISTPPRSYAVKLAMDVHTRLMESGSDDVRSIPNLRGLLESHFIRLPLSYALDVNLDRAEDVLIHHSLLEQAAIPENRPAFYIRLLERLYTTSDGNEHLPLTSVNSEPSLSRKQQKVAHTSSNSKTKDGAAEFERLPKLEDLNLGVAKRTFDGSPKRRVREPLSFLTHEVIFSTVDRPKLLSQLSALLSDIGLNIREAHVFSTIDGYSLAVFVVDGCYEEYCGQDTALFNETMKNAVAISERRRSSHSQSVVDRALAPNSFDWEVDLRLLKRGEIITSGFSGSVYRGTYMGQEVAIKELNREFINETLKLSKFVQEVKILRIVCQMEFQTVIPIDGREVRHRNVVSFLGACTKFPFLCIVTGYMSGGNLYTYLRKRNETLKLSHLLKFAIDICKGMEYLHSNNIIHRDLKTPNLLLSSENVVKVSDFGISRYLDRDGIMTTERGSYGWMAPEIMKHLPYDESADVFSFAIVLWELVTAKAPFRSMNQMQAAWKVMKGNRLEIPENTHPKLSELIQRCWETDPIKRPTFSSITLELECLLVEVETEKTSEGAMKIDGRAE